MFGQVSTSTWAHGMSSAVDGKADAGGEAGQVAGQKGNSISHLIGGAWSAQCMCALRVLQKLLVGQLIHAATLVEIGHRYAGIHTIGAHSLRCQLEGNAARELIDTHLGDVIGQDAGKGANAIHTGHIDNVALGFDQLWSSQHSQMIDGTQIGVHHTIILLLEQYDRVMNTNVRSLYQLTMLATPELIKSKGNIVNVSSVCGLRAFPGLLAYNVSKSAVDQFTRCVALELAPKGVRVNSVNPGVIVTELQKRGGLDDAAYAKFLEHSKATHPLGRPGEVGEVAAAIAFLASEDASFTTGVNLTVDGGRHVMCPR